MQIMLDWKRNKLASIRVFPNPTNASVRLNQSIGIATLYHVNGTELTKYDTDESLQIDLSNFQAGSYF